MESKFRLIALALALLMSSGSFAQSALDAEVERYLSQLNSSQPDAARKVVDQLTWSGITDPRLFDAMEKMLLAGDDDGDGDEIDELSWLAKGLALSGDQRYLKTLRDLAANAGSKKLRKYCDRSIARLNQFEQWNPHISAGLDQAAANELNHLRIMNMLRSEIPELTRQAAKMIFQETRAGNTPPQEQTDASRDLLLAHTDSDSSDMSKVELDAIKWQINVLGAVKDQAPYREALLEIANNSSNKHLAKYAKKRLK